MNVYLGLSMSLKEYFKKIPESESLKLKKLIYDFADSMKAVHPNDVMTVCIRTADDDIKRSLETGHKISCKRGCNACCHVLVACTEIEVDLIIRYIKAKKIDINMTKLKRLAAIKDWQDQRTAYLADPKRARCIFLKKGECSIYPVRPICCRKYMTYSPAECCELSLKGGTHDINIKLAIGAEVVDSALLTYSTWVSGKDESSISLARRLYDKIKLK